MVKEQYLAKSAKKNQYNEEPLESHTNKLINLFKDFIKKYGEKFTKKEIDLIMLACEKHDLGKLNYKFQKEMYKKSKLDFEENEEIEKFYKEHKNLNPIPHGILSCCFINSNELKEKYGFDKSDINILATSIYNHHDREFNSDDYVEVFEEIIEKDLKVNAMNYGIEYCNSNGLSKNKIKNSKIEIDIEYQYNFWLKFIVIKGMLNKIDYAASTYLYNKKDTGLDTLELTPDDASDGVIKKFGDKLNDCQEFMQNNNDKNIIVIASTGIGKTEGALLWAGDSKTFYTLPIKVSINAIYKRIWDENYYDKNKFTFLHSDAKSIMRKDEEIDDYQLKYIETRHLIYPLTICTVDQLFYFVFKSLGTEKYAATLKYSKVIIDEIQSYTPDIISFLIFGLKVVNDLGGKFCIMTATLPPIVKYFLEETIGKENIKIAEKPFYKKDDKGNIIIRHKIKYAEGDFEYSEILKKAKDNKVLIICNTVRRSQEVFEELEKLINEKKENIEINLLHSRFIFKDRKTKEEIIQDFASSDNKIRNDKFGIWISTQIVEASLDIDFDVLYTDMCSADSLLQRMGRCYRNRIYKENEANIFIYDTKIGVGTVYDKDIFEFSVEHIQEYNNKIFTEEDKQDYINKVYDIEKLKKKNYYNTIRDNIKDLELLPIGGIEIGTTKEQFRNIQNITVIPRIFYNELIEKNIFQKYDETFGEERMDIIEKIMNYTLSAPLYFEKYCVKEIKNKELEHIFISNSKYDEKLGLLKEIDEELEFKSRCS